MLILICTKKNIITTNTCLHDNVQYVFLLFYSKVFSLYLLNSSIYFCPISLMTDEFLAIYPIVIFSSVLSFIAQYSEPLRSSQIIPEHNVYPFIPTIRFSIVALSFALTSLLYSYVLRTSSAK